MSSWRGQAWAGAVLALALGLGGRVMTRVDGNAMWPTLKHGDRVMMTRRVGTPGRGHIVGLRSPKDPAKRFVLRLVGMPRERVSIVRGVVHIDGRPLPEPYVDGLTAKDESAGPVQLGSDEYFVLGDNRRNASDSREWGPITRAHIFARWKWW